MAVIETTPIPAAASQPAWHGHAFGLDVLADEPIPGVVSHDGALPGPRSVSWEDCAKSEIDGAWAVVKGTVLLDLRHTDGRHFIRVDHHPEHGYRIWAPYYGRHLVSSDGRLIRSALPNTAPARWQRLFFAQPLPLAAALHGLELFQASAVALDDNVLAFVGPPGTGKKSVAANLMTLGATFMTDHVLAIEVAGEGVRAHPGPARLSIDQAELRRLPLESEVLGVLVGKSDKVMLEPPAPGQPLPLTRLYFLRRTSDARAIDIVEPNDPPARALLGSSFFRYLRSPDYLQRHLESCAAIAASVRVFDVELPAVCGARDVAARVLAHCESDSL